MDWFMQMFIKAKK